MERATRQDIYISDDNVIEAPAIGIPAIILEEIGAGRGCGVVSVAVGVVTGDKTEDMENKLDIDGRRSQDGGRSKTKSSVYQNFGVPSYAPLGW